MLEYFPNVYWANLMFSNAVTCGATLGDVDDACRPALTLLRGGKSATSTEFKTAHRDGFAAVAERLERFGSADVAAGRLISASDKQLRATALYLTLQLLMDDYLDPAKAAMFNRARASFRKTVQLAGVAGDRMEFIGIEFEGTVLDGLFIPAPKAKQPTPVVVHVNGGESTLEWPYLTGMTRALAARGIASLTFDHPGSGSARFNKGLQYRYDAESFAGAAVDYLVKRGDVDHGRIGIWGASLGGYYAPRAAALDKRFKACAVLSAYYEAALTQYFGDLPPRFLTGPDDDSALPAGKAEYLRQARWRFGARNNRDLYEKLERFSLNGVLDKLHAPLVIVHGQNDVQVPLLEAERVIREAVNSPKAELHVLGPGEGDQHCSLDNLPTALDILADWTAETLGGHTRAV